MKRIRIDRPKIRREHPWPEDLPPDPRDPDVVRAKVVLRAPGLCKEYGKGASNRPNPASIRPQNPTPRAAATAPSPTHDHHLRGGLPTAGLVTALSPKLYLLSGRVYPVCRSNVRPVSALKPVLRLYLATAEERQLTVYRRHLAVT